MNRPWFTMMALLNIRNPTKTIYASIATEVGRCPVEKIQKTDYYD